MTASCKAPRTTFPSMRYPCTTQHTLGSRNSLPQDARGLGLHFPGSAGVASEIARGCLGPEVGCSPWAKGWVGPEWSCPGPGRLGSLFGFGLLIGRCHRLVGQQGALPGGAVVRGGHQGAAQTMRTSWVSALLPCLFSRLLFLSAALNQTWVQPRSPDPHWAP